MSNPFKHEGYCPNCLTNVEHVRLINSRWLKLLDRLSLRVAEVFGLGPWYCLSCGQRRLLFPLYRRNVGSYSPRARSAKKNDQGEVELMGNVFLSSVSLVHRSNRANYYSEKFRDGVAEQLLSCAATFSAVKQRLGVSDLDLQDWIAQYHRQRVGSELNRLGSNQECDPDSSNPDCPAPDNQANGAKDQPDFQWHYKV